MLVSKEIGVVWISKDILSAMTTEAERKLPDETGGVILGYLNEQYNEAVIARITGPGPKAVHRRYSFTPDYKYQESEIAKHYRESGRLHTYLGDWHTHPRGSVSLSNTDRRTLRRIAMYKDARLPIPLMAILGGISGWNLKFWCYEPTRLGNFGIKIKARELEIKYY